MKTSLVKTVTLTATVGIALSMVSVGAAAASEPSTLAHHDVSSQVISKVPTRGVLTYGPDNAKQKIVVTSVSDFLTVQASGGTYDIQAKLNTPDGTFGFKLLGKTPLFDSSDFRVTGGYLQTPQGKQLEITGETRVDFNGDSPGRGDIWTGRGALPTTGGHLEFSLDNAERSFIRTRVANDSQRLQLFAAGRVLTPGASFTETVIDQRSQTIADLRIALPTSNGSADLTIDIIGDVWRINYAGSSCALGVGGAVTLDEGSTFTFVLKRDGAKPTDATIALADR